MSHPPPSRPWWWLSSEECGALDIGVGVSRSELGVVFGAPTSKLRIEIVSAKYDAPVRVGPIALRVWGRGEGSVQARLVRQAARILASRVQGGFAPPDAIEPTGDDVSDASVHNSPAETIIDVPSTCLRACVFCHIAFRKLDERRPRGTDEAVDRAIDEMRGDVLFTGDDALFHPRIAEWIAKVRGRGHRASVIGPPRLGETRARVPELAAAGLWRWSTALLGPHAELHDALAGERGSYAALTESTEAFRKQGVRVEYVTPLVVGTLPELAAIAASAKALTGRSLSLLAYAPDPEVGRVLDAQVPSYAALRAALASLPPDVSVDSLPLCVLPEERRRRAGARLERTAVGLSAIYDDACCAGCDARARCPGVPTTVMRAVGAGGLVTLRRSSSAGA